MKYFWLILIVTGGLGLTAAWSYNFAKFGHRQAFFDRLNMDDVTADNVMQLVKAEQVNSGARVELLSEEKHNFGVMAPGEKGDYTFRIKNVGTDDLTLVEGASTCKCTIGELGRDILKPGEETEVVVSWTVKSQKKEFSQRAQVITNDPYKVVLNFEIEGEVVRDIEFAPREIQFDEVAAGEPFEVTGQMFSFYDTDIKIVKAEFGSTQLNELSEFEITAFEPTEEDKEFAKAKKGYKIKATVQPGMRQGAVSTTMRVRFNVLNEDGSYLEDDDTMEPIEFVADVGTTGFIAGLMSMVESTKIKSSAGGYIMNLGKLSEEDSKKARGFIKLKGSEADSTELTIGEVKPAGVVKATLGKPINQGSTVLYPLELEIIPGNNPIDMTGKSKGDYGSVWIESDNPKVPKMLIGVKFAVHEKL